MSKTPSKTKPAISWPGGKRRMLKHLLPVIPPDHYCYVEVFGGGLATLLAKPPSRAEVANDINQELIAFYRCVKFHADELCRELEFVLNSRQEFADYLAQPGLTEIQRVSRWYHRNVISFGGQGEHFGTQKKSGGASMGNRFARMESIRALNTRLAKVCIECLSWEKILEKYDAPETCFFLDPPYFDPGGTAYGAFSEIDFQRLAAAISGLRGQWVLTFQDHPSVRAAFSDYPIQAVERANGIGNSTGKKGRVYRELIVWNHHNKAGRASA